MPVVILDLDCLRERVYAADNTHITVKNARSLLCHKALFILHKPLYVVIVLGLHYLVARAEDKPVGLDLGPLVLVWVNALLQHAVKVLDAELAFSHGRKNLDIKRRTMQVLWQLVEDERCYYSSYIGSFVPSD